VRSIVDHTVTYKNHIDMVYTKYLCVNISVALAPNVVVSMKDHDVAMGSFGVDNVLRSVNIICRIIEPCSVVVIHVIVLEDTQINVDCISSTWKISGLVKLVQYMIF
jgi:uncharacterized membrane protein YecN with MAPEG domain